MVLSRFLSRGNIMNSAATPAEQFAQQGYVYLEGAMPKEECQAVTDHLFQLYENGSLLKDDQCPLSESVYDDVILNSILHRLAKPLSDTLGIELDPTYCYARIYRPGEVLEWHKDRPACEISGTLTLGYDPSTRVWPIFFGRDDQDKVGYPLDIDIGDIVMYRGEELPHWRTAFKGKWQTQVFFHYVDKNGVNSNHAGDMERKKLEAVTRPLNDSKPFNPKESIIHNVIGMRNCDNTFPGLSTFHSRNMPEFCFTSKECDKIIEMHNELYEVKGTVGAGNREGTYASETRSVDVYDVPLDERTKWIFDKIAYAAGKANKEYYKFDLLGITHSLQLLHYVPGGHYDWHIDAGDGSSSTRKLSVVVPLSKRTDYEGGGLLVNNNGNEVEAIMERGSISTFPSFCLHKVEPVTSGERWSLVIWIHGPDRFR